MSDVDPYDLLRAIERVAGREVAENFHAEFAGRRAFFPKNKIHYSDSALAKALGGIEKANQILLQLKELDFFNFTIAIPLYTKSLSYRRVLAIHAELRKGEKSTSQIAGEFGVSERTIYNHRAKLVAAGIEVKAQSSKRKPSASPGLSDIDLDIATSPVLDVATVEALASRYRCTVTSIHGRVRRLRLRGYLTQSRGVAVNG